MMPRKPPQNKYSVKLKRGSTALVGLSSRDQISKEDMEQHLELAKRPLRKNATKGKSPIEAGLIVMRHIIYRTGSNAIPVGHSTLDKLQSLRTDPTLDLLKSYTWSDFFQQRSSKHPLVRPSSANSMKSMRSEVRNNPSPIRSGTAESISSQEFKLGSNNSKTSPQRLFTNISQSHMGSDNKVFNDAGLEINALTVENIGNDNMCRLFEQMVIRAERFWKQLKIPSRDQKFYRQTLLKYPPSCIDQCNEVGKYLDCLNVFKQATVMAVRAIEQREIVLTSVMDFLNTLQRGMEREEEFARGNSDNTVSRSISDFWKDEFVNQMLLLRNRTLVAVKYIQQWRQSLWRPHAFFYENENYLLKIKNDLNILKSSKYKIFLDETNIGFQDLVCIVWPSKGIAYDSKGIEGLTSSDDIRREIMQNQNNNLNSKEIKDSKYAKKLRGNVDNAEVESSNASKWIVAAKVVGDESALQNALSSERDVLKSQSVFIPFLKM